MSIMKVWGVRDSDHVLFQMLVLGDWIPELTGVLGGSYDDPAAGTVKFYIGQNMGKNRQNL